DIDSAIAFFSDFNSFRESICLPVIPIPSRLLHKSIYLGYELPINGERRTVPVYKIPYIVFGTAGNRSYAIYVFFPNIYEPKYKVNLPAAVYATLYDKVLYPGLLRLLLAIGQHIPRTFIDAQNIARTGLEKSNKDSGA
ncbi:hypothetical protein QBC44DRAFT_254243, partial [Cladorrhinum sp. PSN332]